MHPPDPDIGALRGRLDLERPSQLPISFWEWRWDPAPIWMQWALIVAFYYGCFRWRAANKRMRDCDLRVTALLVTLMALQFGGSSPTTEPGTLPAASRAPL